MTVSRSVDLWSSDSVDLGAEASELRVDGVGFGVASEMEYMPFQD